MKPAASLLMFALSFTPIAHGAAPANFTEAMQQAQAASAANDHAAVRDALRAALGFAPDLAMALVYLARAEAALGDKDAALSTLQRLATQGGVRELEKDEAFASLAADPAFTAAVATFAANATPRVVSTAAHSLDDADFLPEGLAHDAASGRFFAGSLNRGGIVQWRAGGKAEPFHAFAPGTDTRVLGLRVDAARSRLWAATLRVDAKAPPHARGRGGWASLEAFDLADGRATARYPAPADDAPHLFNDIALHAGDVYVSDSEAQAVYVLRDGDDAVQRLVAGDGSFTYPNGIAERPGGGVYVSHVEGLSRVVQRDGKPALQRVRAPDGTPAGGFDGMYACGPNLLGIQGRLGFQQVTLLQLDVAGERIVDARALERRHPAHDAPTTGAIVGDVFHYVANAQLRRMDNDWNIAAAPDAKPPVILALPLDGACAGRS